MAFNSARSKYAETISKEFPHKLKSAEDVSDAALLYRKILAQQSDKSIVMVSVGQVTNFRNLLKTGPDEEKPVAGEGEEEVEKELDPNLPVAKNSEGKDVNIYIPMITWEALSQREQDLQMRDYLNQIYENGQMVGDLLDRVEWINMGGGYLFEDPDDPLLLDRILALRDLTFVHASHD